MTLRDAIEDDLPAIVEIYNATIPGRMATADTKSVSIESRVPWFRAHNPRTRPIWVMNDPSNGRVCAWLSFSSFYGRPAYNPTAEISIYVAKTARRRGFGKFLLGEALARAPACDVHTLLGLIFAHNDPGLQLFENLGFARWGHLSRVAVLDSVECDLVIVGRRVAP